MVDMEMGAHDVVDLFRLHAGGRQFGHIGGVQHVEHGPPRARFVVADAGVDQDRVARGFDNVGLDRQDDLIGFRLHIARIEPVAVCVGDGLVVVGQENARLQERFLALQNAAQLKVSDGATNMAGLLSGRRWRRDEGR